MPYLSGKLNIRIVIVTTAVLGGPSRASLLCLKRMFVLSLGRIFARGISSENSVITGGNW